MGTQIMHQGFVKKREPLGFVLRQNVFIQPTCYTSILKNTNKRSVKNEHRLSFILQNFFEISFPLSKANIKVEKTRYLFIQSLFCIIFLLKYGSIDRENNFYAFYYTQCILNKTIVIKHT